MPDAMAEPMPDAMAAGLATKVWWLGLQVSTFQQATPVNHDALSLQLLICTNPRDNDCKHDAQSLQLELCTIPTDNDGTHGAVNLQRWKL